MAQGECQVGGLFRRCHGATIETCQYCGKRFCALHRHVIEGYEAVCTRAGCLRKHSDLAEHVQYRARVAQRNAAGLCGIDGCGPHPPDQCSLCQGHFCSAHMRERMYPYREGRVVVERPASVCSRCWERRKIWRR
jgi:hypothetical protein